MFISLVFHILHMVLHQLYMYMQGMEAYQAFVNSVIFLHQTFNLEDTVADLVPSLYSVVLGVQSINILIN